MAFQTGFWGAFANERNQSMRKLAKGIGVDRVTLYRFLWGDLSRIGREKRERLAKLLKLRTVAALERKIQDSKQRRETVKK